MLGSGKLFAAAAVLSLGLAACSGGADDAVGSTADDGPQATTSTARPTTPTTVRRTTATSAGPTTTVAPAPSTTTAPALSLEGVDFRNFAYPGWFCANEVDGWPTPPDPIVVTDGGSEPWGGTLMAALYVVDVQVSDLSDDGVAEAVVWLDCGAGASGQTNFVAVYTPTADGPSLIGRLDHPADAPGRVYPEMWDLAIDGDDLVVQWEVYGPDDAHCCPSATTTYRYRWNGTELVVVDGPTPPEPIETAASDQ